MCKVEWGEWVTGRDRWWGGLGWGVGWMCGMVAWRALGLGQLGGLNGVGQGGFLGIWMGMGEGWCVVGEGV